MPIADEWFQAIMRRFELQDEERCENIRREYVDNVRSYLDIYGYIGLKCLHLKAKKMTDRSLPGLVG